MGDSTGDAIEQARASLPTSQKIISLNGFAGTMGYTFTTTGVWKTPAGVLVGDPLTAEFMGQNASQVATTLWQSMSVPDKSKYARAMDQEKTVRAKENAKQLKEVQV